MVQSGAAGGQQSLGDGGGAGPRAKAEGRCCGALMDARASPGLGDTEPMAGCRRPQHPRGGEEGELEAGPEVGEEGG